MVARLKKTSFLVNRPKLMYSSFTRQIKRVTLCNTTTTPQEVEAIARTHGGIHHTHGVSSSVETGKRDK